MSGAFTIERCFHYRDRTMQLIFKLLDLIAGLVAFSCPPSTDYHALNPKGPEARGWRSGVSPLLS